MDSQVIIRNCIFCAVQCAPTFITENGEVKRVRIVKSEGGIGEVDADEVPPTSSSSSLSFLEEVETPLFGNQLKVYFILRNILNISKNKLSEYLSMLDGQLHPEFWVEVCGPCGEAVGDYYQTLRLISKLKMKLATISSHLRRSIWDSKDTSFGDGGGDDFNGKNIKDDSNQEETLHFIWRDIRDQALGYDCLKPPSPSRTSAFARNSLSHDFACSPEKDETDKNYKPPSKVSPLKRKCTSNRKHKKERRNKMRRNNYNCSACPYETSSLASLKTHSKLHSPAPTEIGLNGHGPVSCRTCRLVMTSDMIGFHTETVHGSSNPTNEVKTETEYFFIDESTPPPSPIRSPAPSPDNSEVSSESESGNEDYNPKLSKVKRRRNPKSTKSSKSSSTFKVAIDSITSYTCELCPYKCETRQSKKNHEKLHKPGSNADICSFCGWVGTSVTVRSHKFKSHPKEYQNELGDDYGFETKTLTSGTRKKTSYRCRKCGYNCIDNQQFILRHVELHKPDGPKSTSCSHCGWLVPANKLNHHIAARHPGQGNTIQPRIRKQPKPSLKCKECGYLHCSRGDLLRHSKLHESGQGKICEECGWLCRSVASHRANWHPKEGTKKAEIREKIKRRPVITLNEEGEKEKAEENKGKDKLKVEKDDSNWNDPKCIKITHAYRTAYECSACGLKKNKRPGLLTHFNLHKEGSGAVKCGICGWLLAKNTIKMHNSFYHGPNGVARPVANGRTHFKCELCGFLSVHRYAVKEHLEVHEKGEGTMCAECGWWCNDVSVHRAYWHPVKGSWAEKKLKKRPKISRIIVIGRDGKDKKEAGDDGECEGANN
ncbi:unnamed protein product [Orchesella dallaii]|uniref:C2H2-type domain-containing protein n=1 Tax=Orchesella dallaii TaxID=48710 RepID=A0ABP1RTX6_9HEXA